jgi:hypothetical protein
MRNTSVRSRENEVPGKKTVVHATGEEPVETVRGRRVRTDLRRIHFLPQLIHVCLRLTVRKRRKRDIGARSAKRRGDREALRE